MSIGSQVLKKSLWLYFFSFIIGPTGYIVKLIVSHDISVAELGVLYGILSLITLLASFNDFGTTESIGYFVPKYMAKKRYDTVKSILFYAFSIQMITGIVLATGLYFGAGYLTEHYFQYPGIENIIYFFAIYFLCMNIFQIFYHFFLAVEDTFFHKFTDFLRMLFVLLATLGIYFLGVGSLFLYSVAWIIGLFGGILGVLIVFFGKYYFRYFREAKIYLDIKLMREVFGYAFSILIATQAAIILSQTDMQMVVYLLGPESAGYYTNYFALLMIPILFFGPITVFMLPVFSRLFSEKKHSEITTLRSQIWNYFGIFAISGNIFLFLLSEHIIFILFGATYLESAYIFQYSILFLFCYFLTQINFGLLSAIGQIRSRVKIILAIIVWNIILNILLIPIMGTYGAALSTGISWFLMWAVTEIVLHKKYTLKTDLFFWGKNIVLQLILIVGLYSLLHSIGTPVSRLDSSQIFGVSFMIWMLYVGTINFKELVQLIPRFQKT